MTNRTRGNSGSRRKSAAACRKVSRRAKVAWRKRKLVRRIGTQENCGPRKEFSSAGIRMTHSAKVAWLKEHGLQRQLKDSNAPRTPIGRTSRMRRWLGPEYNSDIRDRGLKQRLTRQQADKGPRRQTAAISEKGGDIQLNLHEDYRRREDRESKSRILRRVAENQGLDLVEGSTSTKTEKTTFRAEAGNVETPAPNR
jgi:hypothetical protein